MEKINKNVLTRLGILYGIVISGINFLGVMLSASGSMPIRKTDSYTAWVNYMDTHATLMNRMMAISFIIPGVFCVLYVIWCSNAQLKKRIINIPLMYSIIGALGWVLGFLMELVFLLFLKFSSNISIYDIVFPSLFNIVQESLFIFTFAFLCLDSIHRKFVLPKYFPEGNVSQVPGSIKFSSKLLFSIFYLSVGIFPIFYLFSTMYNYAFSHGFKIDEGVYLVLGVIVVFGIAIVITFSKHFSEPLEKLRQATGIIKTAKYDEKVNIVSCDDFGELADNFNDMAMSLDQKTKKIFAIQDSVIRGMAVMVESRDNSTGGHINRTSDCVRVFVDKLKKTDDFADLSESFCKAMIKAAPMHDLGKIAVDDAILRKPDRFTDEEYEKMKVHSAEGARIVENVLSEVEDLEFKKIAINVAHYHHEKWDGSGYPEKISGQQIPLEARIMALADVFDALVSKRCYKDKMSYDQAFEIIKNSLGGHFDPKLGEVFVNCRDELEALYNKY